MSNKNKNKAELSPRQQPQTAPTNQPPAMELPPNTASNAPTTATEKDVVTLYSPPPTKALNSYSMLRLCQISCSKLDLGTKYPGKVLRLQMNLKKHKKTVLKTPIIENISDSQANFVFPMNTVLRIPYAHHVRKHADILQIALKRKKHKQWYTVADTWIDMNYILQCPLDGIVELKAKDNFALKKKAENDAASTLGKLHVTITSKPISNQELKHILHVTKKNKEQQEKDEQGGYDQDEMTDSSQTTTEEEEGNSPLNSDGEEQQHFAQFPPPPTIVTDLIPPMPPNADDVPQSQQQQPAATANVQPQQQPIVAATNTADPSSTTTKKTTKNISQTFKELMKGLPWTKKNKTQQEEDADDQHYHHEESNSPRNNDGTTTTTTAINTSQHHLPSIFDQLERLHQCKEVVIMTGKSKKARELYDYYKSSNHAYYTCSLFPSSYEECVACMNRIVSLWSNRKTVKRKHDDDDDDDDDDNNKDQQLSNTSKNNNTATNTTSNIAAMNTTTTTTTTTSIPTTNNTTTTNANNADKQEMKLILLGKDQLVHDMVRAMMDVCAQKNVASSFWNGLLLYIVPFAFANTGWDISIAHYIGMSDKHYSSMFLCDEWLQTCKDNSSHHSLSADVSVNAAAAAVAVANIAAVPATTTTTTSPPLAPTTVPASTTTTTTTPTMATPLSPSMNASTPLQQQQQTTTTTAALLDHSNLTKSDLIMIDKTIANFLQQATQSIALPMGQALLGYSSQEQQQTIVPILKHVQLFGSHVSANHIVHVMEQASLEELQQHATIDVAAHEKNMEPIELKMDYWTSASQEKVSIKHSYQYAGIFKMEHKSITRDTVPPAHGFSMVLVRPRKKFKSVSKAVQVEKISKLICNIEKKKGIGVLVDDVLLHGVKFVSISPQVAQGVKLNMATCPFAKQLTHSNSSIAIKNMTDDF